MTNCKVRVGWGTQHLAPPPLAHVFEENGHYVYERVVRDFAAVLKNSTPENYIDESY